MQFGSSWEQGENLGFVTVMTLRLARSRAYGDLYQVLMAVKSPDHLPATAITLAVVAPFKARPPFLIPKMMHKGGAKMVQR